MFEKGLGRPLGQSVIGLASVHEQGENQSERQVDMVLCAGAAARGAERGLNFVVWNFAWDRLASRQWLQILKSCHNFKFCKKHYTWHFLKLLDKICKLWNGSNRTVGATEGMWDGRTDRRTDGVKPIYPPTTLLFGGIIMLQHELSCKFGKTAQNLNWVITLRNLSGTTMSLTNMKIKGQFGSYAIPSEIMSDYSCPAQFGNQHEIPLSYLVKKLSWHHLCPWWVMKI